MEQFWVVMAQWVQSIASNFAQIKKISEKKLGREAPRVRSQSTFAMKHNPQVVGCVLTLHRHANGSNSTRFFSKCNVLRYGPTAPISHVHYLVWALLEWFVTLNHQVLGFGRWGGPH